MSNSDRNGGSLHNTLNGFMHAEIIDSRVESPPRDHGFSMERAVELLDVLVARFEGSLLQQQNEMVRLRQQMVETETLATSDRQEMETMQRVAAVLERESRLLHEELNELRGELEQTKKLATSQQAELTDLRERCARLHDENSMLRQTLTKHAGRHTSTDQMLHALLSQPVAHGKP
jgi:chromosome segregation ATPase